MANLTLDWDFSGRWLFEVCSSILLNKEWMIQEFQPYGTNISLMHYWCNVCSLLNLPRSHILRAWAWSQICGAERNICIYRLGARGGWQRDLFVPFCCATGEDNHWLLRLGCRSKQCKLILWVTKIRSILTYWPLATSISLRRTGSPDLAPHNARWSMTRRRMLEPRTPAALEAYGTKVISFTAVFEDSWGFH